MKILVLVRHAKAKDNTNDETDFERVLTTSGKHDAVKMAKLLKKTGVSPQIFISSTALRALTTANIFTDTLGLKGPETTLKIYEASVPALLQVVTQIANTQEVAALVGHNPGMSNLLYYLTGEIITMQTCAFAIVELQAQSWGEVAGGTGKITQYSHP